MKLKDSEHSIYSDETLTIHACDMDGEGNIENIDIIVNDKLKFCINIHDDATLREEHKEALALIFHMLCRKD